MTDLAWSNHHQMTKWIGSGQNHLQGPWGWCNHPYLARGWFRPPPLAGLGMVKPPPMGVVRSLQWAKLQLSFLFFLTSWGWSKPPSGLSPNGDGRATSILPFGGGSDTLSLAVGTLGQKGDRATSKALGDGIATPHFAIWG
jgi:hypothetical protein